MTELVNINENSNRLLQGIESLIEQTDRQVAVYLNTTISRLYWAIGNHIVTEIQYETYSALPDKQWFIDKLNKSIAIAQQSVTAREEEKELANKVLNIAENQMLNFQK